jgi:hypothetical protein
MLKKSLLWIWLMCLLGVAPVVAAAPLTERAALAFFYGINPPLNELQAFDLVVVDPDHLPNPNAAGLKHTRFAAYVSVGEVQPSRAYAASIPADWLVGDNNAWGSRLIDQSRSGWPQFFSERVIAPLWAKGYRTFFLDTLDSYQLFAKTPESRAQQEAGLVEVMRVLKQSYPDIKLLFNRGFEILPQTHQWVEMVVAESLFQSYNAHTGTYGEVPPEGRDWLLAQFAKARIEYGLPGVAIDYVPASKRELARQTAKKISDLGLIPWVATPDLATLGVGLIEVMPRRIAVVHSVYQEDVNFRRSDPVRFGAMPLNYLGYVPEYFDVGHLPSYSLAGRYAAVLLWLDAEPVGPDQQRLSQWLDRQLVDGIALAAVGFPSVLLDGSYAKKLGLMVGAAKVSSEPVRVKIQHPMFGFERTPSLQSADFFPLAAAQAQPLLTLQRGAQTQVAAALTAWGGYVLANYAVVTLPGGADGRWVIDPFAFFKQAMRLPEMPVPDTTTESGRRLLMVHMDGDGFISRSELPGHPLAGELVRDRVVKKYAIPMTLSVIEAELSPTGLYPGMSAYAEAVAQDIFRAPHVAIASHSYSHPFSWSKAQESDPNAGYNLRIPGYKFDLDREITGSIQYIEKRLAPPGKKVDVFLWTGDCVPGAEALVKVAAAGVVNMNGGDTTANRSAPSMTKVEGLGLRRGEGFQVFAPNQNENVYTNNWQGPFYGFERVIETFEFTESPRRLKPIDIYFHSYITTKAAGIRSLDKVFAYALEQDNTPVFVSEYAHKVLDFQNLAVARTANGWRVRGAQALHTLRLAADFGAPDIGKSQAVAGFNSHQGQTYVHLSGDAVELVTSPAPVQGVRLVSANGRVEKFESVAGGYRWDISAHVPLKFNLAHAQGCQVKVAGRAVTPKRSAEGISFFEMTDHVARPLEAICRG